MSTTKQGRKDGGEKGQIKIIKAFMGTVRHYYGKWEDIFQKVKDWRDPKRITYPLAELLFTGLLMYICQLGSRRNINHKLRGNEAAEEKSRLLFGTEQIPHGDTLNYGFKRLAIEEMQAVVSDLVAVLIRKKVLARWRLFGVYYLVAIDGTGVLSFTERHCEYCLTQQLNNGTIRYYHPVLEAKLITTNGFALSLMTEFIKNREPGASKQDCELKAFYRLAERLKKRFPRLPICLLLDGLFAGGPTFGYCEQYGWKFLVVLTDSDLPDINYEFEALMSLAPDNRKQIEPEYGIQQTYRWMDEIHYVDSQNKGHMLGVLECVETKCKETVTKYKLLTNFLLTSGNVHILANNAGRLRWKIENEGFNLQKNGCFRLEHPYSQDDTARKVFYFLLQIAFLFFQLMEKGSLFRHAFPNGVGSLKNIAFRLLEAWRNLHLDDQVFVSLYAGKYQIRFDSS